MSVDFWRRTRNITNNSPSIFLDEGLPWHSREISAPRDARVNHNASGTDHQGPSQFGTNRGCFIGTTEYVHPVVDFKN